VFGGREVADASSERACFRTGVHTKRRQIVVRQVMRRYRVTAEIWRRTRRDAAWQGVTGAGALPLPTAKVALSVHSTHHLPMAKTWVSKNDSKSARAFAKAMRLLSPKNTRRQNSRSR
jgi:hypothetical protein